MARAREGQVDLRLAVDGEDLDYNRKRPTLELSAKSRERVMQDELSQCLCTL